MCRRSIFNVTVSMREKYGRRGHRATRATRSSWGVSTRTGQPPEGAIEELGRAEPLLRLGAVAARQRRPTQSQLCEKAREEGRTIVFVDECGLSQKSTAKQTWAPVGETPVLEMNFNWDKLSVIGGISLRSIYFQIHEATVESAQVIGFLDHLQRYVPGRLLVIWDGLPAHRSKVVAEYLGKTAGRVWVERLPAYAPELNPIEYLWGNVKGSDLACLAPKELWELSRATREALFKQRRRPKLLRASWVQTERILEGIPK